MAKMKSSPRKVSQSKKAVQSSALVKIEPSQRRPLFADGTYFDSIPLFHLEKTLSENQYLSDLIVDFCLEYLKINVLSEDMKEETVILNSFEFTRLKQANDIQGILLASEQFNEHPREWCDLFDKLYRNMRPAAFRKLEAMLNRRIIILPAFWHNHWFLVMIVNIRYGTLDHFVEEFEQFAEDLDPTDPRKPLPKRRNCRIIFMDSKIGDPVNRDILKKIHDQTFRMVKQWIKTILYKFDKMPTDQFKKVRCEWLPQQPNDTDCGVYVFRYAEYFAAINRNWMDRDDEEIEKLVVTDADEFQQMVAGSRKWIRGTVDRLSGF